MVAKNDPFSLGIGVCSSMSDEQETVVWVAKTSAKETIVQLLFLCPFGEKLGSTGAVFSESKANTARCLLISKGKSSPRKGKRGDRACDSCLVQFE